MHLRKPDNDVSHMIFWSAFDNLISLSSGAADVDCPDIVVSDLPFDVTIDKVLGMIQFRAIENTHKAVSNGIDGAQNIRIKKSTGAWGTDDVVFLPLVDNLFLIPAWAKEVGGGAWIADNASDCKSEVDENVTYNVRFEDGKCNVNDLLFHDFKCGLKMFFHY